MKCNTTILIFYDNSKGLPNRPKRFLRFPSLTAPLGVKDSYTRDYSTYPLFDHKYDKRHAYPPTSKDTFHEYQPQYIERNNRSDVIISQLREPSWFSKALHNIGNFLMSDEVVGTNSPTTEENTIVTDKSKILKLNLRHVLRGT